MRARNLFVTLLVPIFLSGCMTGREARYVYQDGQFGVVAIPRNTDEWPGHYREQAEDLMKSHFPGGYEVVRAEEVVEGVRTLTTQGSTVAEIEPALPAALLKLGKLGRTATRNQADCTKIKECRIVYKKAGVADPPAAGFAAEPTLTPTMYVDPNLNARKGLPSPDDPPKPPPVAKAEPAH